MRISIRIHHREPSVCLENDSGCFAVDRFVEALASSFHPLSAQARKLTGSQPDTDNFLSAPGAEEYLCAVDKLLRGFLQNGDPRLVESAKVPDESRYLPPIPKPPLVFGLAGNCPQTWRREGVLIPNYPVGYVRPWKSLSGHKDRVELAPSVTSFRCAAELGVVIGKTAFKVTKSEAFSYIFGFTCVNDMIGNQWKDFATRSNPEGVPTFEELLVTSYYGRGTDGFGPVGPTIATPDEVGDPYNLLMYTYQNGELRDRSYTNAMVVGIENTIEYLSGFMTLQPGSIIHMGTMGVDGITIPSGSRLQEQEYVEIHIERVGRLRTYFKDERQFMP